MTYILINREALYPLWRGSFKYCHERGAVEANCATACVRLTPKSLTLFTPLELSLLYKNMTGEAFGTWFLPAMYKAVYEVLQSVPVTEKSSDGHYLELQAEYVLRNDPEGERAWAYVPGAAIPKALLEFAPPVYPHCQPVVPDMSIPKDEPAPPVSVPVKPAPRQERPAGAAPKGSVSEVIWQVADSMWQQAGAPTDKKEVLTIRKAVMDVLETDYSVKRNTASNELGNWQKARIIIA